MEVIIGEEAQSEILDIRDYYNNKEQNLGSRFIRQLEYSIDLIKQFPEGFPRFTKRTRRTVLIGFPFSIVYTLSIERITIIAVFHSSRKPGYWKTRLKN